jgi:hypothetical protein
MYARMLSKNASILVSTYTGSRSLWTMTLKPCEPVRASVEVETM